MTQGMSKHLHVLFAETSLALNESAITVGEFLADVPVEWTPLLVKEFIWRSALHKATDKTSTKELTDEQAEKLMVGIAERLQQKYGVNIWERINLNQQ